MATCTLGWISETSVEEGGLVRTQDPTVNDWFGINPSGEFTGLPGNNNTVTIGSVVYTFKTVLTGAAFEVLIGGSAAATAANLDAAINDSGVEGTNYGNGTTPHPDVTSSVVSATLTLSADVLLDENASNFTWSRHRGTFYDMYPGTYRETVKVTGVDCDAQDDPSASGDETPHFY